MSDIKSFEEVYKSSYSHGLESIYKLETIDLKTVKKLESHEKKSVSIKKPEVFVEKEQFEFDFGVGFRDWIPSFLASEPIQVLNLNKHSEKCLLENGLNTLKDVFEADLMRFIYLKGMGQGHIEEIKEKLKGYTDGKSLEKDFSIDFRSWILSLALVNGAKKAWVFLESYDLHELISLSPLENAEVRKLSYEMKSDMKNEVKQNLNAPEMAMRQREHFRNVTEAFLRPWIRFRGSIAVAEEIEERLLLVSLNESTAKKGIRLFKDIYNWSYALPQEGPLYFSDTEAKDKYYTVCRLLEGYFYNFKAVYSLEELYSYICSAMLKRGVLLESRFFKNALFYSPNWHLFKEQGKIFVRSVK